MVIRTITESLYIGHVVYGPPTEARARLDAMLTELLVRTREAMKTATWRNGRP
jgi:hypothetical protein